MNEINHRINYQLNESSEIVILESIHLDSWKGKKDLDAICNYYRLDPNKYTDFDTRLLDAIGKKHCETYTADLYYISEMHQYLEIYSMYWEQFNFEGWTFYGLPTGQTVTLDDYEYTCIIVERTDEAYNVFKHSGMLNDDFAMCLVPTKGLSVHKETYA
jgi:hypothetical protein